MYIFCLIKFAPLLVTFAFLLATPFIYLAGKIDFSIARSQKLQLGDALYTIVGGRPLLAKHYGSFNKIYCTFKFSKILHVDLSTSYSSFLYKLAFSSNLKIEENFVQFMSFSRKLKAVYRLEPNYYVPA